MGVRPLSGQTVSLLDADPERVTFQAAYQAPLCSLALSCGLFIQCALLSELAALDGHPEEWLTWYATFLEVAAPLHASGRGAMQDFMQERAERCTHSRPPVERLAHRPTAGVILSPQAKHLVYDEPTPL